MQSIYIKQVVYSVPYMLRTANLMKDSIAHLQLRWISVSKSLEYLMHLVMQIAVWFLQVT